MLYRITNYSIGSELFYDVIDDVLSGKIPLQFLKPEPLESILLQLGAAGRLVRLRYPCTTAKEGLLYFFGVEGRAGGFCCTEDKELRLIITRYYEAQK